MMAVRYAIYFAPEEGTALHRFGRDWLGRDPRSADYGAPLHPDAAPHIAAPRRYGFHATLKAPFRLRDGSGRAELAAALRAFAAARAPFVTAPLELGGLDGFLALRPRAAAALDRLAADCVRDFEAFRAPPDEGEPRRRGGAGLSPRQAENLRRWGYPYVFEDFRFHMTLTGRLDAWERERMLALLGPPLAPVLDEPLAVASVCLFEERPDAPFVLAERFAFGR